MKYQKGSVGGDHPVTLGRRAELMSSAAAPPPRWGDPTRPKPSLAEIKQKLEEAAKFLAAVAKR